MSCAFGTRYAVSVPKDLSLSLAGQAAFSYLGMAVMRLAYCGEPSSQHKAVAIKGGEDSHREPPAPLVVWDQSKSVRLCLSVLSYVLSHVSLRVS